MSLNLDIPTMQNDQKAMEDDLFWIIFLPIHENQVETWEDNFQFIKNLFYLVPYKYFTPGTKQSARAYPINFQPWHWKKSLRMSPTNEHTALELEAKSIDFFKGWSWGDYSFISYFNKVQYFLDKLSFRWSFTLRVAESFQ